MKPAIEAKDLTKTFRDGVVAVAGLDLIVEPGAVFGLIGRNGAGKTTTLRLLAGLLRPDSGHARVMGAELWSAPRSLRQQVAYVSQNQQLPGWMRFAELERYVSHFYDSWDHSHALELARRWGIPQHRPVSRLSAGEQRQTACVLALAARPRVLLLDEPAAGLDPVARRGLLGALIEAVASDGGCTLVVSTHLISDLERVAEHVGFMDRGRLTATARLEDLLNSTKRVQVVFDRSAPPPGFSVPGALRMEIAGPVVRAIVRLANDEQLKPLLRLSGARVDVFPMRLEEIFVELFDRQSDSHDKPRQGIDSAMPEVDCTLN